MNKLLTIIIDDERLAREEIRQHLNEYPDFEIIAEAADADEAEQQIRLLKPSVIFLDIRMPERSGLDLLESLDTLPAVVFTTAYDRFAVKAFELNALDYLLKPIRKERFAQAVQKTRQRFGQGDPERSIFIREGDRFHFVRIRNISLLESAGNYVRIYADGRKYYLKRSLSQLEEILDPQLFFRINRTEIINTSHITQLQSSPKGKLLLTMQSGEKFEVSARQSALFKNRNMK